MPVPNGARAVPVAGSNMQVGGAAGRSYLVGRKRSFSEMMNGGPTPPPNLPQLATSDNTPTFFPNQEASSHSLTMGWRALPPEMEHHILCSMPLLELARVSTTCHAFQATFRRRMAEEEKAGSDMAIRCFGRKWVTFIAGLVDGFLKGEAMDPTLKENCTNHCWISAEGLLEVVESSCSSMMSPQMHEAIASPFVVQWSLNWISILVPTSNQSWVNICVFRERGVWILVNLGGAEVLEGMAFVQALLTWGKAPSLHDAHLHVSIELKGCRTLERTAFLAQILPLFGAPAHKWRIDLWWSQLHLKSQ